MKCHKCNQNSIGIKDGHILCDICGLDIDVSYHLEEDSLFDLFFYNQNLEEAEKLGHEALSEGKKLDDNPFGLDANNIALNKMWQLGFMREVESYEYNALSISSEKIENSLKNHIHKLKEDKENLDYKIKSFMPENYNKVIWFFDNLLKTKVLGFFLKKKINQFKSEYTKYYKKTWSYPE